MAGQFTTRLPHIDIVGGDCSGVNTELTVLLTRFLLLILQKVCYYSLKYHETYKLGEKLSFFEEVGERGGERRD